MSKQTKKLITALWTNCIKCLSLCTEPESHERATESTKKRRRDHEREKEKHVSQMVKAIRLNSYKLNRKQKHTTMNLMKAKQIYGRYEANANPFANKEYISMERDRERAGENRQINIIIAQKLVGVCTENSIIRLVFCFIFLSTFDKNILLIVWYLMEFIIKTRQNQTNSHLTEAISYIAFFVIKINNKFFVPPFILTIVWWRRMDNLTIADNTHNNQIEYHDEREKSKTIYWFCMKIYWCCLI